MSIVVVGLVKQKRVAVFLFSLRGRELRNTTTRDGAQFFLFPKNKNRIPVVVVVVAARKNHHFSLFSPPAMPNCVCFDGTKKFLSFSVEQKLIQKQHSPYRPRKGSFYKVYITQRKRSKLNICLFLVELRTEPPSQNKLNFIV